MNDRMPCFTDCDDNRLPADNLDRARAVEDYADKLMAECVTLSGADGINKAHDVYDGGILPSLMVEIACWTGSSEDAVKRMRSIFNLLADEFQCIAERETK